LGDDAVNENNFNEIKSTCVIVLNWNGFIKTRECVESIIENEESARIIVVDNDSRKEELDRLSAWLKNYGFYIIREGDEYNVVGPALMKQERILYLLEKNYGYARGNNKGLNLSLQLHCEFAAICNNDVVFTEPVLTLLTKRLKNDSSVAIIGPRIVGDNCNHSQNPMRSKSNFYFLFWRKLLYPFLAPVDKFVELLRSRKPDDVLREIKNGEYLSGCFFVARTEYLKNVGFFDEHTFLFSEEEILLERIKQKGYKSVYCPSTTIIHRHGQSTRLLHLRKLIDENFRSKKYFLQTYRGYGKFSMKLFEFSHIVWVNFWIPLKNLALKLIAKKGEIDSVKS